VYTIVRDRYAGNWPSDQFAKHGITSEASELSKSEIYGESLPLLNAHKVELLDNTRFHNQLGGLERRVIRGTGRESIDHGAGRHDDCANAALGALLRAATQGTFEISDELLNTLRFGGKRWQGYGNNAEHWQWLGRSSGGYCSDERAI
jgi:hypothetical protein